MTPDMFFSAFVEGNAEDYFSEPSSVRKAFNVSIAASHMADQYFEYYKRHKPEVLADLGTFGDFIQFISNKTDGAFRDIRSISNVYKHLYSDSNKRRDQYSVIDSNGAIDTITLTEDDRELESIYCDYQNSTVCFTRKSSDVINFGPQIKRVVDFWSVFLISGANG